MTYLKTLTNDARRCLRDAGYTDQQIIGILDALAPVLEHAATASSDRDRFYSDRNRIARELRDLHGEVNP
jgi:ABC-type transporter Mla subunit MlaD